MIVVSDTTPIISLMKAGRLKLLQELFGVVYIPKAVYQELTENETFLEEIRIIQECEFLYVEEVGNEKVKRLFWRMKNVQMYSGLLVIFYNLIYNQQVSKIH